MRNVSHISTLTDQIRCCAERLQSLVFEVDAADDGNRPEGYEELVDNQFFSELEFLQRATLMLTRCVVKAEEHADESAFAEGELDDKLGEKKEAETDGQT